jgi:hypothetical protein
LQHDVADRARIVGGKYNGKVRRHVGHKSVGQAAEERMEMDHIGPELGQLTKMIRGRCD